MKRTYNSSYADRGILVAIILSKSNPGMPETLPLSNSENGMEKEEIDKNNTTVPTVISGKTVSNDVTIYLDKGNTEI